MKPHQLSTTPRSNTNKMLSWTVVFLAALAIACVAIWRSSATRNASAAGVLPPSVAAAPAEPLASTAPAGPLFAPTVANATAQPGKAQEGMEWIPGGEFSMGAQDPPDKEHDTVGMKARHIT